ncbi:hypothetical protein DPMN_147513 [Dreissena polymorpha]|uniref:Uncharacterized protein n=1 Tax=Dreissena polymorpha TaxID=45954 RepID=A0A9D4J0P3_DREPO|nr:hypothetical protein DPMN_147513 [Dreissena polymorpha]
MLNELQIKCYKRLNESQMKRRPCTVNEKGAHIFLRYRFGKRVPYKRYILKGKVLQISRVFSKYRVIYRKQDDSVHTESVSVEHITSRTLEEERNRREKSLQTFRES